MLNSFVQEVGLCYDVVDRQMQTAVASFPFANLIVEWLKLKLITSMCVDTAPPPRLLYVLYTHPQIQPNC